MVSNDRLLPGDVLNKIWCHCDQVTQAAVSNTCRLWHQSVAPHLYRSPCFTSIERVESFTRYAARSDLKTHVRNLSFTQVALRWSALDYTLLADLLAVCPRVISLDLDYCLGKGDPSILFLMDTEDSQTVSSACSKTSATPMSHTKPSTTKHNHLRARLPYLEYLGLSNCVIHPALPSILSLHPRLRHLDLSYTSLVDEQLAHILTTCHALETLSLRNCGQITEQAFIQIQQHSATLRRLNIQECYNILDFPLEPSLLEEDGWVDEPDSSVTDEEDESMNYRRGIPLVVERTIIRGTHQQHNGPEA
ncbi:hypothetical protein IWQ61_004694 [Dispira simplex]|nr:hypothetical protein IWQ61_004694 [Dispira simplex]